MFKEEDIVSVILPLKINKSYFYKVPKGIQLNIGDIVRVPLNKLEVSGIIISKGITTEFDEKKIKYIIGVANGGISLQPEFIDFLIFVAKYNLSSLGNVLKMAINTINKSLFTQEKMISLDEDRLHLIKMTSTREKIINLLRSKKILDKQSLQDSTKVSSAVINLLIKKGVLSLSLENKISNKQQSLSYKPTKLLLEQQQVYKEIQTYLDEKKYNTLVLRGLPGSGKTEVYFEAMNKIISQGGQVLLLLPEIGLSTQIVSRFKDRFGVDAYVWNSNISESQRKEVFLASTTSNLKVVIGARSALFLPFSNLRLIIVDEEHDSSYKQEESVIYNARDMAVVRAKICNIPIILSSATPSLETMNNVYKGKYKIFYLNKRYNQQSMPNIQLIDLNKHKLDSNRHISEVMVQKITEKLTKGEQVLLFLNKRGYSSCLYCTTCREQEKCNNCSVSLTEHRSKNLLLCHLCGFSKKISKECSNCNSKDTLISVGVGIEKIFDEIQTLFPEKKVLIISSDTIKSNVHAEKVVEDINTRKYDILIGTQIISKGYNFPFLTFVGILDGDFSHSLDLKSTEKSWQIFYQVAGRSGRDKLKGEVMLQTYDTSNTVLDSLRKDDYDDFLQQEIALRKKVSFPPFGKLIAVILSSKNINKLNEACYFLEINKITGKGFEIFGPTEAPVFLLRGMYRKRFLIKSDYNINIQTITKRWLSKIKLSSSIKIQIDVDPLHFY